jgi:methyl coenzyme M reductase gamma subunit
MQSKHPPLTAKEMKLEAMRKLKAAYDAAKASGNVRAYKVANS